MVLFPIKKRTVPKAGHWGVGFKKPTIRIIPQQNKETLVSSLEWEFCKFFFIKDLKISIPENKKPKV